MSAERTGARLLRAYPPAWRRRYGRELEALIAEASDGGRVGWRTRLDVLLAGGRERLRAAAGGSPGATDQRVKDSLVWVLCAWALFVVGGLVVQRFSEHWQAATPATVGSLPGVAFGVLVAASVCGALLVVAGIGVALPSFVALLRAGGWQPIRRRATFAAILTALALAAIAGLVAWASGLDSHQREGSDTAYAAAFVVSALLVCGCLAAWTATAAAIARRLELGAAAMRLQSWLATAIAIAMATVTAATVAWWVSLAGAGRSFLAGPGPGALDSTLPPELVAAVALMIAATLLAGAGARRALHDSVSASGRAAGPR